LFFIVSGIFLGSGLLRKGVGGYINNRFQTIFYPLVIWGIIQVSLQISFSNYVNADREPMDYLNLVIDPRKIEQFWYLNALFFVSVLYAIMSWYAKFKPVQQLVTGLFFYAIASYFYAQDYQVGFLQDVLFFYVFFAIGDLVADLILNNKNYKLLSSYRSMLLLLPVFVALQHYFTKLNLQNGDDYYVQFHRPELYIITALVGCAFVMNVSFVLQKLNIFRYLRVLGYHSLFIYVMHLMITAGLRVLLVRVLGIENVPMIMIISVAGGVLLPIMFYNLAIKAGAWWLFTMKRDKAAKPKEEPGVYFQRGLVTPKESVAGKN
jgi:peptidoglycan/LPS O-acetylase OafA/YrhL